MNRLLSFILLFSGLSCMSQGTFKFSDSAVLQRLTRDVYILASDSFAGRKSGTASEQKAYLYITGRFREAGLTPHAGSDSSFLQPFPAESYDFRHDSSTFSVTGYPLAIHRHDFCPVACSANGRMDANRYILINLAGYHKRLIPKEGDSVSCLRDSIRSAFKAGIPAVILYNEGLLSLAEIHSLYQREKVIPEKGLVISVNDEIAAYIIKHPGAEITAWVKIQRMTSECHNIIGFIDNNAPYTVVIGAHYDHLGVNSHGKVFNGADDNASGTAMLLELARYLKQSGDRSGNYLFISFSGEEEGLYGSAWFVAHPSVDLKTVSFMMNLDMVGRLGCEGNVVTFFGTGTSKRWHKLYKETKHPDFRLSRMHGVHSFSDHLDFYGHGIPIISLTTGFHYEYHTTRDDPETLNYPGMMSLARYLESLLHNASKAGKDDFYKVSGWYDFSTNFKIILKSIDHMLAVGMDN